MSLSYRSTAIFMLGVCAAFALRGLASVLGWTQHENDVATVAPQMDLLAVAQAVASAVVDGLNDQRWSPAEGLRSDPITEVVRTPISGAVRPEVQAEPTDDTPQEDRLSLIESKLDAIEQILETGKWVDPPPPAEVLRRANRAPDWSALDQLYSTAPRNSIAFADSIRFATYEEILVRFGSPTTMSKDNVWYYSRAMAVDDFPTRYSLTFVNGIVVNVGFAWN